MKLSKYSIIYRTVENTGQIIFFSLLSGGASLSSLDMNLFQSILILAGIIAAVFLISVFYQYLYWKNYDYTFSEGSLNIKRGVIKKENRRIPLRRIQNIDISKNIVQRFLGIAQVNFETAGGSETEASLKYIEVEQLPLIQNLIKSRVLDERKEEKSKGPLFALSNDDLILMSVISMDKKVFGGSLTIISIVVGESVAAYASDLGTYTVPLFLFGLFLLAWAGSAVFNFFKYYDFKLWRSKNVLEYERGLLNRYNGSIPIKKIQTLSVEENPLKRMLGYASLKVETAGYAKKTSKKRGSEVAIPLASRKDIITFGRDIENFSELSLQSIPRRAKKRYAVRYSLILGSFITIAYLINHFIISFDFWYSFLLAPLILIAAHYEWKHKRFSLGDDHFFAVRGFWNRKTVIVPYYRIQNLIESRNILQERWNLSSLILDTASTGGGTEAVAVDIDIKDAEGLRGDVFDRFRESMLGVGRYEVDF